MGTRHAAVAVLGVWLAFAAAARGDWASIMREPAEPQIVTNARVREPDDDPPPKAYRQVLTADPNSLPVGTLKYEAGAWYRKTAAGVWVPHHGATPALGVAAPPVPFAQAEPVIVGTIAPVAGRVSTTWIGSTATAPTAIAVPGAGWYGATSGGCASGNCASVTEINGPFGGSFRRSRAR
jgi:hypothetical protein